MFDGVFDVVVGVLKNTAGSAPLEVVVELARADILEVDILGFLS